MIERAHRPLMHHLIRICKQRWFVELFTQHTVHGQQGRERRLSAKKLNIEGATGAVAQHDNELGNRAAPTGERVILIAYEQTTRTVEDEQSLVVAQGLSMFEAAPQLTITAKNRAILD